MQTSNCDEACKYFYINAQYGWTHTESSIVIEQMFEKMLKDDSSIESVIQLGKHANP